MSSLKNVYVGPVARLLREETEIIVADHFHEKFPSQIHAAMALWATFLTNLSIKVTSYNHWTAKVLVGEFLNSVKAHAEIINWRVSSREVHASDQNESTRGLNSDTLSDSKLHPKLVDTALRCDFHKIPIPPHPLDKLLLGVSFFDLRWQSQTCQDGGSGICGFQMAKANVR